VARHLKNELLPLRHSTRKARPSPAPVIDPIVAATVQAAWSHPGHCRAEAAFARLAGAARIPASSGKTVRYRLNRFGDRQLNRALHTVVLCRLQRDERTRVHAARRRAQGKTDPARSKAASSTTSPESATDVSKHPLAVS
jgi:transposase